MGSRSICTSQPGRQAKRGSRCPHSHLLRGHRVDIDTIVLLESLGSSLRIPRGLDTCSHPYVSVSHLPTDVRRDNSLTSALADLSQRLLDRPPPVQPHLLFALKLVLFSVLVARQVSASGLQGGQHDRGKRAVAEHGWDSTDYSRHGQFFFTPRPCRAVFQESTHPSDPERNRPGIHR